MYIFTAVNSGERCGPWASCFLDLSEGMESVKCLGKIREKSGNFEVDDDKWQPCLTIIADCLSFSSYIFWMGDLNCRLDDTSRESVIHAIENNEMEKLLKLDQV